MRPVGHDRVAPEDALERRADAGQRVARALVARVGLELDPVGAERLERVGQLEQLRLAVRAGPLERAADPGPADLEALVLRHDRHEPAAADGPSRGAMSIVANGRSVPASALASAVSTQRSQTGLVLRRP